MSLAALQAAVDAVPCSRCGARRGAWCRDEVALSMRWRGPRRLHYERTEAAASGAAPFPPGEGGEHSDQRERGDGVGSAQRGNQPPQK